MRRSPWRPSSRSSSTRLAARRQLPAPERRRHLDPVRHGYKEPWMTIGIVAGWMLIVLGLSLYARGRIGEQRWRKLHRFTALAWMRGVHTLGQAADAGKPWFLVATGIVVLPAAALLVIRMSSPRPAPAPSPRRPSRDERRDRHRGRRAGRPALRRDLAAHGLRGPRAHGVRRASRPLLLPAAVQGRPRRTPGPRTTLGFLRPASWYADHAVELLLGAGVGRPLTARRLSSG